MSKFGELIETQVPVLFDFYTDWDEASKEMHPVLRDVAAALGDKARVIKIDVERHEFQCLRGMLKLLRDSNNKVFIQIEIIDKYKDLVLDLLEKMHFSVVSIIKADGNNISYGSDYYLSNF